MYRLFKNNYFFQDKLLQQEYSDFKDYRAKIRLHFVQKKCMEIAAFFQSLTWRVKKRGNAMPKVIGFDFLDLSWPYFV